MSPNRSTVVKPPHLVKWYETGKGRCKYCGADTRIVHEGIFGRVQEWFIDGVWGMKQPQCKRERVF